jgi:protein-S-isoprenylcysteine O-methyltransferase Ste14
MNRRASLSKTGGFSLRLYPPLWFLLFALAAFCLAQLWPLPLPLAGILKPLAVLIAASGGALAIWAGLLFRRHDTSAHPYAEASRLVTRGPYRLTRNPMYLGLLLALSALALWLQSLSALLMTPLFLLVINLCNILPEERRLRERFGADYEAYRRRTRRWL